MDGFATDGADGGVARAMAAAEPADAVDREGGSAPQPTVRIHFPAEPLRPLVTSYYVVDVAGPMTETIYPEWGGFRFALRGHWVSGTIEVPERTPLHAALSGPSDRWRSFSTTGGALLGVGLTPLGWAKLVRRPAGSHANQIEELGDLLDVPGDRIAADLSACADDAARCAILNDVLVPRAAHAHPDEAAALRIQSAMTRRAVLTAAALSEETALPLRTLDRICRRVFGFGPKRLLRRQRFLRTLALLRDRPHLPFSESLDAEYYDQAHFIREFRDFMGTTPTAFLNTPRELMRRLADERTRVIGAPLQGLD